MTLGAWSKGEQSRKSREKTPCLDEVEHVVDQVKC